MDSKTPFVAFRPLDGQLEVMWQTRILHKKNENGTISAYAPGFDIYFGAADEDAVLHKASVLTRFMFDHYLLHGGKHGLKKLVLQLHSLGFQANNNIDTIHKLINNKRIAAKFRSSLDKTPANFFDAKETTKEGKMQLALEND